MRWVCPTCNSGALAPERPRKDDVRRYCLPCSKRTGKLVERAAPVLQARREKAAAQRSERTQRLVVRETECWTVAGVDVRGLARECWTALGNVVDEFFADRRLVRTGVPTIILRRRRQRRWKYIGSDGEYTRVVPARGTSGWARGHSRVTLLVNPECDLAKIRELMVHELAHCMHCCLRRDRADRTLDGPHGDTFNRLMVNAAARLWGVTVGIGRPGYEASDALERALRAALTETA